MRKDNIKIKHDIPSPMGVFMAGSIFKKFQWAYEWQGMSPKERDKKGIFVDCYGHGWFFVLRPEDYIFTDEEPVEYFSNERN